MKTHLVYTSTPEGRLYFAGVYKEDLDIDGYAQVEWEWDHDKEKAVAFYSTDAWDLLNIARHEWPQAVIELERIVIWKNGSLVKHTKDSIMPVI